MDRNDKVYKLGLSECNRAKTCRVKSHDKNPQRSSVSLFMYLGSLKVVYNSLMASQRVPYLSGYKTGVLSL